MTSVSLSKVQLLAPSDSDASAILPPAAVEFVSSLHRAFSQERKALLAERERRQRQFDAGLLPHFLSETQSVRESGWKIGEIPSDLVDRRVEITGPAGDRKMVINALNSGASTYMADFEDSQSPTWRGTVGGQVNLRDAVRGDVSYTSPEGKSYRLDADTSTLIVRPRGLHLDESHLFVEDEPVAASFFDFGLFLYHNVDALRANGTGPYFYIPKLESHREARLWGKVCSTAEGTLGLPHGTIKLTVLIETLPAAFEMDEILYELRDRAVGLNCGRWDYIFSYIKKLRNHPRFLLPDRSQVTMNKGFLAAYADLLIRTCHRRGAYAIGGMSAYIPVKGDGEANEIALSRVRVDKEREARLGHDGAWVAHPGLVPVVKAVFEENMRGLNQLHVLREDVAVTQEDLLRPTGGCVTMEGVRTNVAVGLRYLASWLDGRGCVPINGLMEDAATAEICRAQIWQWVRHGAHLDDGREVTLGLAMGVLAAEASRLGVDGDGERIRSAQRIFTSLAVADNFGEFLTLPAYSELTASEGSP
ncbi:MAG TPA: malate synthase A [Nitrososphaerales archaeon]|nr:malate synthase A [Nitrososphaerales archaeon]